MLTVSFRNVSDFQWHFQIPVSALQICANPCGVYTTMGCAMGAA